MRSGLIKLFGADAAHFHQPLTQPLFIEALLIKQAGVEPSGVHCDTVIP